MITDLFAEQLVERPVQLSELREGGAKTIGYVPNGFLPEELLYASGALPVGIVRGGDPEPVAISGRHVPRFYDAFYRCQLGYREFGEPLYQELDLLIVPVTDNNPAALADVWDVYSDVEVFRVGVPHEKSDIAVKYYREELARLKKKIEDFMGATIEDDRLKAEAEKSNLVRGALRDISNTRLEAKPPISGKEFARLNHASYLLDRDDYIGLLDAVKKELSAGGQEERHPRILLVGSTMAMGDYKVFDLLEETGAEVVIELFDGGMVPYLEDVQANGDMLDALVQKYLVKRVPTAYQVPSSERIDFILGLAKDFKVDGVIWYQNMYSVGHHNQSFYFEKILKNELDMPMLKLETDYDRMEMEPMRTRVETYVEILKKRG